MIDICICDNDVQDIEKCLKYIEKFRQNYPEQEMMVKTFDSSQALLEYIQKHGGFDLYLLDIIMPEITGIELSKEIRKMRDKSEIIFLTVSSEYAVEAFGVRASGYLLKPVAEEDFNEIVSVCMERIFSYKEQSIMLKTNDGMRKIDINMLVMVESFNHTRILLLIDGTRIETPVTLTEIFERLSCYKNFYMPHRAYIVNMAHVTGIKKSSLLLAIGMEVPIAKGRQDKIKSAFLDYFFGSSKI